ncbi:MAG: right-handed parallel beta-helix repeat-containing protein [Terracidiphilus sp.]
MIPPRRNPAPPFLGWASGFFLALSLSFSVGGLAQSNSRALAREFFVDCSAAAPGDGSSAHPLNSLADAQAHRFLPGERIALRRGTACHGSFAPEGSGNASSVIRLTAYGEGARPRIVASAGDRQALLLFNQEYWQIDSLDLSGSSTYGVFASGDKGTLHHIYLKNLFVHDVQGGAMKSKDNGLVVVGPSSRDVFFEDVLVDGAIAAHTNQWAGILIGGGDFHYANDAPLNTHVTVRNSSVEDVYGDGIILFRDSDGLIETSTAWETGMQPTETVGTPNAIWTWTCTDCVVRDNEAYLTDSPGVDGGGYDIDWDDTRNTVERNYAHDTQGYCFAVFGAGYVTSQSVVRDNLCIANGLSPRLAALQGAVYLRTWNGGLIDGLRIEHNTVVFDPPVASAAAIVDEAETRNGPVVFAGNRIESSAPLFYRSNAPIAPGGNTYQYEGTGDARFTLGDRHDVLLTALQAAGFEKGSTLEHEHVPRRDAKFLRLDAEIDFALDSDGLLAPAPRAQLMVLRSLAAQYGPEVLAVNVHWCAAADPSLDERIARANALLDLDAGPIRFKDDGKQGGAIRLTASDGRLLNEGQGFQNAAALGGAVRARLGAPHFPASEPAPALKGKQ